VGFNKQDSFASVDVTVEKILNLRVFQDAAGKTNLSLRDTDFELLVIPNFTLSASTKKGRRPSFDQVLSPAKARVLYQYCLKQFKAKTSNKVAGGIFGADMKINNSLDGPLNFVLKSI
jgi:D-tyrosyl-tRNA(Tyr) deacylase